jgi:hypothetical protein
MQLSWNEKFGMMQLSNVHAAENEAVHSAIQYMESCEFKTSKD